ncbi:hypothetical protein [Microvirga sp. M2]|uniref:hypothetical protein n=1 Tax=Microvirga sp. M2 TaxID=3073270 RepID=UPI0039C08F7A
MMRRVLIAAVAANAAAPCLFVLVVGTAMALADPNLPRTLGSHLGVSLAVLVLSFQAVFSTALPASLIFALAGFYYRWRSPWIYLAGGAVIGLGFILWYWGFTVHLLRRPYFYWIMAISLVCAWLYWLIARRALAEASKRA